MDFACTASRVTLAALAIALAPDCRLGVASAQAPGNVLVVVIDDVGVDRIAAYGEHPDAGPTPVIDSLAANGLLFRNAYANASCSPTRMTILSGRYGFRTGVGHAYGWAGVPGFTPGPRGVSVAEPIATAGYRTGLVGKWHLCTSWWNPDPYMHPILVGGFDVHLGSMANLNQEAGDSYFHWEKNVATKAGAIQHSVDRYATSESVDDALRLIGRWDDDRWLLWLAFNAGHSPFHVPPADLHTLPAADNSPTPVKFRAAVEALDTELGRLLSGIPAEVLARTTIIVVGDNGTPQVCMTPPMVVGHYKASVYEGGINVPLIVSGYRVAAPGREVEALVNTTDLFGTLIELTGATDPGTGIDSVSLLPYLLDPQAADQRRWVYSELFEPNGFGPFDIRKRAVRAGPYKLIVDKQFTTTESLFDLDADPFEEHDLLPNPSAEQQAAYASLKAILGGLHD